MKKFFMVLAIAGFMSGCATSQPTGHHHHEGAEFDGKCAYSVAHGNHDVSGKPEFNVEYKGKTYYFSDANMKEHFVKELEKNVVTAQKNWSRHMEHGRK